ncbi:MAG: Zn-ribbon domain-containing OB-fold protein [Acidimicrobiales bacterium]
MSDPAMVRDGLVTADDPPALIGGRCEGCGHDHFPATDTCPYCGSESVGSVRLPTRGTLWAWTAVTSAPPGYTGRVPFGFGVVELEGRLRVVSRLTQADPSALQAGQPMRLVRDEVAAAGPEAGAVLSWAFAPSEGLAP